MTTLEQQLRKRIEADIFNHECWANETAEREAFKNGANLLLPLVLEMAEALEFYSNEENWSRVPIPGSGVGERVFTGSDSIGTDYYGYPLKCGVKAIDALATLQAFANGGGERCK